MAFKTFKKKILSIDGGGIRGILPAMILNYIEEQTKQRISTMFDLIAGTSTGGILALGLNKVNSDSSINSEPEYTARELVDFYVENGKTIFNEYIPTAVDDLLQPKFNPKGREEVLTRIFGKTSIERSLKQVFITSYDIELRIPVFFTSNPDLEDTNNLDCRKVCKGFTMAQAAMATSAAPTFFPPYKLDTVHRTSEGYYALVDGGIFANNPTALAMMEAEIAYQKQTGESLHRSEILVVSLGTGSLTQRYRYKEVKDWGQLKWVIPLLSMVLDSQSESVAYQLEQTMITRGEHKNYYRFQVPLSSENDRDRIDNVSSVNLDYLKTLGKTLIEQRRKELDELCEALC
jgi:uncharacterized protein